MKIQETSQRSQTDSIRIFVINMERSVDRRYAITKKLNSLGLQHEVFNAVDGESLSSETMKNIRSLSRGEAGAALSHLNLYQKIVNEKIDFAIIMEDDAEFDERLKHLVNNKKGVAKIMAHFELVLLGYCLNDLDSRKPAECSYWGRKKIDNIIKVGIPVFWYWLAICYLISFEGAQKLLNQGKFPRIQADFLTANSPKYNVKLGIIYKPVVWPGELANISTIRDTHLNWKTFSIQDPKNKGKSFYDILKIRIKLMLLKLSRRHYLFVVDIR